MLFDQRDSLHTILTLTDDIDFGEAFQQKGELIAGGLFVVHDDGVDGHESSKAALTLELKNGKNGSMSGAVSIGVARRGVQLRGIARRARDVEMRLGALSVYRFMMEAESERPWPQAKIKKREWYAAK